MGFSTNVRYLSSNHFLDSDAQLLASNGTISPRRGAVHLRPTAWGCNGHANPANTYAPYGNLYGLMQGTMTWDRMESMAMTDWTGAGRPSDLTTMTKWSAANGMAAQLASNAANGVTTVVSSAYPGSGTNPSSVNTTDMINFLIALCTAIQNAGYPIHISISNECINAVDGYSANMAALYQTVIPAVKASFPSMKFWGPDGTWGFATNPRNIAFWNDPTLPGSSGSASPANLLDVATFHIYDATRGPEQYVTGGLLDSFVKNAIPGNTIPTWITEVGWRSTDTVNGSVIGSEAARGPVYARACFVLPCFVDGVFFYQIQNKSISNPTYGLFDSTGADQAASQYTREALKHVVNSFEQRCYNPSAGTQWASKFREKTPWGVSERLALWDTASSTPTIKIYSYEDNQVVNITTIGGTTSTTTLSAGINNISTPTLGTTPIVYWAPAGRIKFLDYLDG